ncbi:ABC transporter substrate-binding protein [Paenibacillus oceani]|uniref:Extracellular solute-binding protein n=1 Tax=Paenibacillus oceani TaxID=2772510 RepID=A0A927CEX8_9BACL|nr:extracellular solute-binding protein [Paenibacillus oceani]MBD2865388.1 extracellular solute-binding protein [Paenibacillus oceani]
MKMGLKQTSLLCVIGLLGAVLNACGGSGPTPSAGIAEPSDATQQPSVSTAPVTLTLFANLTQEYIDQYIVSHIKRELPHITIKTIIEGKGSTAQDLVTAGTIPDLLFFPNNKLLDYNELGLLTNLDPLIKAHNIDLSRIDDGLIDSVRKYSEKGELLTMPFGTANYALYYNKDIFDKFAVPYPKDGMNWEEVYQLAVRLTRSEGGVQYKGFNFAPSIYLGYNQLSAPLVADAKAGKASFTTDAWKKLFETYGKFTNIPGNETAAINNDDFTKNRTVAMGAGTTLFPTLLALDKEGNPLNFDIVSFPSFPETPKTSLQFLASTFAISPTSKYKDQAMQVIKVLLSDEVQKQGAGILRLTALKSEEVRKATGKDYPSIANKNLKALYANKLAPTKEASKYDEIARKALTTYFSQYVQGQKDLNTALREAEEDVNKKIAEEMAKKK